MGLESYRRKRAFEQTPEPRGKSSPVRTGKLRFVVQKHHASRLHYDFRLEAGGVLKSWAVPKGPSLNPADKRLAMMVEDHPLEYRKFEGIIPEGNYGAGSVIVWDQGTYELPGVQGSTKTSLEVERGLRSGHLKFQLVGEKLRGEFALVRIQGREAKTWLLIKKQDQYASTEDVGQLDRSVVTNRTLDEVAAGKSQRSAKTKKPRRARSATKSAPAERRAKQRHR